MPNIGCRIIYTLHRTGEYKREWDSYDYSSGLPWPKYPRANYVSNRTWRFYDEPSLDYYKNGDYFHGIIYIFNPSENILRLEWGWKIINNQAQIEYLNTHYYK